MPPPPARPSCAGVRPLRDGAVAIPRFDNLKLNQARHLTLLGAGREKKIYAVPPFTDVKPLDFEDYPFAVETFEGKRCRLCGAEGVYLDELVDEATGETYYQCNDTNYCASSACQPTKPVDAAALLARIFGSKSFSRPEGRHLGLHRNLRRQKPPR